MTNLTTKTSYDANGTVIAVTDPKGISSRTISNVRDLAKETIANCTDSGSTPTTNPRACTGQPPGTQDTVTNVHTTMTYDGQGAAVSTIVAVGVAGNATSYTAYDAAGRVQASKDPMGTIARSFYNTSGQLTKTVLNCTTTSTIVPFDWVNCTGAGTNNGTYNLTTTYTYDSHGNQATVTAPNGRITKSLYDDDERLITRIENFVDGIASGTTLEDLITSYAYDEAGRQSGIKAPTASATTYAVTQFVYDENGRLETEIHNCTDTGTTVPLVPGTCTGAGTKDAQTNLSTTYAYDARGNRTRMTAPDPAATSGTATTTVTTQYAYDIADRLCRVVENATGTTDLQALADPCSTATQTAGTATTNVSTRYTHDDPGRLVSMIDARGNTTTYGYDAAGRMTSLGDALGKTLVWAYDALGNRIRQENRTDVPMTASVTWTHDGAGRILTRTADGVTTTTTYDANGNRLTVGDGTYLINAAYDRLNRPLTVDDEDAGTTADTTYTYSLTAPAWTDVTGTYGVTLDTFDRALQINDPVNAANFITTYRADGQRATFAQPNGNTTDYTYDTAGHLTGSDDDTAGGTDRAVYAWTYNRAGQVLTEASTISGDASNGLVTYAYDPLGRLTGSTLAGTTTAYGWDATTNRTSVQIGAGTPATTAYNGANRPISGANPTESFSSDDDGRLLTRPNQQLVWDRLGRLTQVKNGGGTVVATYTYDPLDRLRTVDTPGVGRIRFRYVGLTTSAAQWLDDVASTVTRSIGTGWSGERLLDWTGSGSNIRIYGENAHHDVTWLASSTGTVSQALRYDPWGNPRATVPSGYSPFRFQGSWFDDVTSLSWVVTRWYAQGLGRFVSEDSLLGDPIDPPSRHLYAYGQGEPIGRWDPDGRWWHKVVAGETLTSIASAFMKGGNWRLIWNRNRNRIKHPDRIQVGWCLWITPVTARPFGNDACEPRRAITGIFDRNSVRAASRLGADLRTLTWRGLIAITKKEIDREANPSGISAWWYEKNANSIEEFVDRNVVDLDRGRTVGTVGGVKWVARHPSFLLPPTGQRAITIGGTVFLDTDDDLSLDWLTAHEYIHVLQGEDRGILLWPLYGIDALIEGGGGPSNRTEAIGYLWEGYIRAYGIDALGSYGDNQPWCYFTPVGGGWDFCDAQDYQ